MSNGPGSEKNPHWEESAALVEYDKHFNLIQAGIRGLASTWMLAAFAGFSFFVHPEVSKDCTYHLDLTCLSASAYYGLEAVALISFAGLLVLWILDQLVYHRLLLSSFLVGMCLEYVDRDLPPVRWVMAASDREGVSLRVRLFYMVPMLALVGIAATVAILGNQGVRLARETAGCWAFIVLEAGGLLYMFMNRRASRLDSLLREPRKIKKPASPLERVFPGPERTAEQIVAAYRDRLKAAGSRSQS